MKKTLFTLSIALIFFATTYAQLTGVKTIPGDYPTVEAAITALNVSGAGTGGVTFNVTAGHTETFATPTAGYITTLTGSLASPVAFQKSGAGNNPVITAATGVGNLDAIIAIAGCDYVSFDGIDLSENPVNASATTRMEWGYAILKASATEGSQNITIKNSTITLNKNNSASTGIYSNNHTTSDITQLDITSTTGANSYLKIYNNTIANCYFGIYLSGYNDTNAPYSFYDQNNEIGEDGANFITNVGGGTVVAYGLFTKYQNNLKVANNTITSTTVSSGAPYLYGIYMTTANNASFDFYGNTVSIQYTPNDPWGNSSFYAVYCDMGAEGTTNIANVYDNTVTNCSYPTSGGSATSRFIYLRNLGVTANVYGNVVSNNTIGGPTATTAGEIRYFWCQKVSNISGPFLVHDNSVTDNARIQSVPGGGVTYILGIAGNGTTLEAYNNTIDNISIASNGGAYGLWITFDDSEYKKIYDNTVTNLLSANGSTSGMRSDNGTLGYIYNNKIQTIKSDAAASGASINGLYVSTYGTNMYFYNNMISDLSNPAADATLGYDWNKMTGIYIESAEGVRGFYNNTIYLNSTVTATQANYGSSAIIAEYLYGVDLRNNILINTSASFGPNGKTVGIRVRNPGITGFTSNYNNIYAGTPGSNNLLFYDGATSSQTLSAYQTFAYPQELQSKTEMPPFVNITTQPWDIHLKDNVPTQCEAGGVVVSSPLPITSDIDGDPRYPNTGYPFNPTYLPKAPDIGADEIGGIPNDLTPPSIVYIPLYNTDLTTDRELKAEIKDGTGVFTDGSRRPVLYWKINSGSYQAAPSLYEGGSTYSFTFGAGAITGDVVSYYIAAQDMSSPSNVGVFPSLGAGGFTSDPPACSTPPTNPSTYSIVQPIAGEFHVGVGKTYTTLSAAVNDLNSKSISGPVTFILDDNSYPSESYPIIFDPNAGSSPVNTVTIRANSGALPVLSSSIGGVGLLMFKGMDYVTIDGSNGVTSVRRLTIENSSEVNNSYTIGITNDGTSDPSTNITLKNCNILGNNTDVLFETYLIVLNINSGINGGGYDNILIDNNWMKRAKYGINVSATTGNRNQNLVISNNIIGSPESTDFITRWGIAVELSDSTLITGNEIVGPATEVGTYACFGILYYNFATNTKITNNEIHDWISSGPGSWGIKSQNDDPTTFTEISNNLIYNIGAHGMNPGVSQNQANGIMVRHGGNLRIWNNTILLTGDYLYGGDTYAPSSSCILFWHQTAVNANNIDVRNNIFQNSMKNTFIDPDPSAWGKAYGIMVTDKVTFSHLDNNDYFIDGYEGQIAQLFCAGGTCLVDFPTLASWQAYTGMEANSITVNPEFTSTTNLIPTTTQMNNAGVYISSVPTDYDGTNRSNPCDMGAYEFALDQTLDLKVFIEGAYNISTNTMNTDLLNASLVPLNQPYNPTLPYYGNNAPTWLYGGNENVTSFSNDVVDWVVVEMRDAASAASAGNGTIIPGGTKAALLKSDGTIVDTEGHPNVIFAGVPISQDLFVVIYHRNHLGIISANAVTESAGIYSYDYSTGSNKVLGGTSGYKQIDTSPVVWGMVGADGNGNGLIQESDLSDVWGIDAGKTGYSGADYDLNIQVNNQDKDDQWLPNNGKESQIPN